MTITFFKFLINKLHQHKKRLTIEGIFFPFLRKKKRNEFSFFGVSGSCFFLDIHNTHIFLFQSKNSETRVCPILFNWFTWYPLNLLRILWAWLASTHPISKPIERASFRSSKSSVSIFERGQHLPQPQDSFPCKNRLWCRVWLFF